MFPRMRPVGQVRLERVRGGDLVHHDGALRALDRQLDRLPRGLRQILEEGMGGADEAHVRQGQIGPGDHRRTQMVALGLGIEDHEPLPLERAQHPVGGGLGDARPLADLVQAPLGVLHVEKCQDGEASRQRLHVQLALLLGPAHPEKRAAALPL